jgi:rod shape determining protein RodA
MMRIDRRLINNFDWPLFASALLLSVLGIMTIFSATRPLPGTEQPVYYIKQIYWLLLGLAAMVAVMSIDYSWLNRASYRLYAGSVLLLVLVLLTGKTGLGARRWFSLGPLSFQPSELFKLVFLFVLSRHLSMLKGNMTLKDIFFLFFAFLLVPFLLVLKQPDLGTSAVLLALFVFLLLARGVARKAAALAVVIALISVPFIGNIVWDELKDYQKKRIIAFVQPDANPDGLSYHITQSKVAVGSGGLFGKGYMKGTQGPFRFLPEKHTDFVFSIFAEEWGFLGSLLILILYFTLILRGLKTAEEAKDGFGRLLALGITFMFLLYVFVNIGMTLGLMPVVGIPLPFMSYGGTAMLTNFIAVGILINIRVRRFELFY